MPFPTYGAAPLAKTFVIVRVFQLISFFIIVGIFSNFTAEIINAGYVVAKEIVGTLSVTCIATLYTLISLPFFYAEGSLTLLILSAFDSFLLLAFIIISVIIGRPLSYMDCRALGGSITESNANDAYVWVMSLKANFGKDGSFMSWTGVTKSNCYQTKVVWGLCIALCILFAMSLLILPALFMKQKRASRAAEKANVAWGA